MIRFSRRETLMLGTGLLLAGCQREVRAPIFPDMTFQDQPPQRLRVATINVVDRFVSPRKLPNVEHTFPTPPAKALTTWCRDRLQPAGGGQAARFVINQAAVIETQLPRRGGLTGLVAVDAGWRWDGTMAVTLEVGNAGRSVQATANRSVTLAENIAADERDDMAFQMVRDMVAAFDGAMMTAIRQNLPDLIA